jgi:hypothetical protein
VKAIRRFSRPEWVIFTLTIVAALAVRVAFVGSAPFWVDEAESSVNALTILQHGYPTDHYLGVPIYENTLVWPWPGNPEYEFRDISYSDKGMAIYHGWLPLYAIAASFALNGIRPEESNPSLEVRYAPAEARRRTAAARLPSVLFGILLLPLLFAAGNAFYGREAAWIALFLGAAHPTALMISNQARYYAATATLSLACSLSIWMILAKGTWRHFLVGAVCFVLLFHTHLLSFALACGMAALMAPIVLFRRRADWKKVSAFAAIVAAGIVPWLMATGFLRQQSRIPRGWTLLSLSRDLSRFAPGTPLQMGALLTFLLLAAWFANGKRKAPDRFRKPLLESFWPVAFLIVWIAVGYLSFLMLMPAASLFHSRIVLSYWGAKILLLSIICASLVRMAMPRIRAWGLAAGALVFVAAPFFPAWSWFKERQQEALAWRNWDQIASQLRHMKLRPGTKLYATQQVFPLFYMGMPFENIEPVRKSFLDTYPGNIVIVDNAENRPGDFLTPDELQRAAKQNGAVLSRADAEEMVERFHARESGELITRYNAGTAPRDGVEIPTFLDPTWRKFEAQLRRPFVDPDQVMTTGYQLASWSDWIDVFFYRFVNPDSRRGSRRNFIGRLRGATAYILRPWGVVIYSSPGGRRDESSGLDFVYVSQKGAKEQ